jgi:hypothetical protein
MYSPLLHHGTRTTIRLSEAARGHISAIQKIYFAAIVTIAVVLAIAGWPNNGNLTSVLNNCPNFRREQAVEAEKYPTTTTTFIVNITTYVLPAATRRN